jgi:hypothetical protein
LPLAQAKVLRRPKVILPPQKNLLPVVTTVTMENSIQSVKRLSFRE